MPKNKFLICLVPMQQSAINVAKVKFWFPDLFAVNLSPNFKTLV